MYTRSAYILLSFPCLTHVAGVSELDAAGKSATVRLINPSRDMALNADVGIDDDFSLKEDDEPDRIFVARYLRTITAWTTAVASMIKMQRFRLLVHARLMMLPSPQVDVTKDTIRQFVVRMESLSDSLSREKVTAFLELKGTGMGMLGISMPKLV